MLSETVSGSSYLILNIKSTLPNLAPENFTLQVALE